jgi:transcriptional regulator with XRE-family HTH domain|tara:strand:- start:1697 stop:2353 length:657 start_codon:yes stop_codon:yes gene_type:complete
MSSLGERLNFVRKNKGMTMEEFGKHLGYGQGKTPANQVMSRMFLNYRQPTQENLIQLSEEGIDLNWLLTGKGELKLGQSGQNAESNQIVQHYYDGPHYVETVITQEMLYPQLLGYSINEIYTIKIDTQMMFPTIKINDLVNAVKVDEIRKDGLYVHINLFRGMEMLWINRLFHSPVNASYICKYDHPNYENVEILYSVLEENILNLRVFSTILTVDKI